MTVRLAARLWAGVRTPAPESFAATEPVEQEKRVTFSRVNVDPKDLFLSMLNSNQRAAWDGEWLAYGAHYQAKWIPVCGRFQWYIVFYRQGTDTSVPLRVFLADADKNKMCFHAYNWSQDSFIEQMDPYRTAIGFLTQIQADDRWVREHAGR
jgi:hypothetical protein